MGWAELVSPNNTHPNKLTGGHRSFFKKIVSKYVTPAHGLQIYLRTQFVNLKNKLQCFNQLRNGQQLMCHVFTQNKGAYINKLNEGSLSIPTSIIDLNKDHIYDLTALER
jgi:hypothetical protein